MKILYICGTYAPGAFAGSEISVHQLLKQLNSDPDINVIVATDKKYTNKEIMHIKYDGVELRGIEHEQRFTQLEAVIRSYEPDVILTQLLWSDVALELGESYHIPTVLRIPSKSSTQDVMKPTALVANSKYICDYIKRKHGRYCHYIFSTIDLDRVIAPANERRPIFITMFNPIKKKGGEIFKDIAKAMPDREFAVVPGWYSLRKSDGSWDLDVIKNSIESQNDSFRTWMPEDACFDGFENVKIFKPTEKVKDIFALTRILLVPSQYNETLARVSIEAYANGIPVIGSKVGGLQEHLSKAGYLIEDYKNPQAWVSVIELMDDKIIFDQYSIKALQFINNEFSNEKVKSDFRELFHGLIENCAHKSEIYTRQIDSHKSNVYINSKIVIKPNFDYWFNSIKLFIKIYRNNIYYFVKRAFRFIKNFYISKSLRDNFKEFFSNQFEANRQREMLYPKIISSIPEARAQRKIVIIIPYFGHWPEWLELFFESCRTNSFIDWLLFTDCNKPLEVPANVSIRNITLEQFLKDVEHKLGINITWKRPYKICDLRPAFGEIFEDEIESYNYYGWGDLDVIYGDMKLFINEELLNNDCISFCKKHLSGHFCLWKNLPQVRKWFRQLPKWRERMENINYTHLDEMPPTLMPDSLSIHAEYSFNTPLSPIEPWTNGTFHFPKEWYWKDGKLTNDIDGNREFIYLHFMHWKGGWWPRECGNAQWEKMAKLVYLKSGEATKGFRINEFGFSPIKKDFKK